MVHKSQSRQDNIIVCTKRFKLLIDTVGSLHNWVSLRCEIHLMPNLVPGFLAADLMLLARGPV